MIALGCMFAFTACSKQTDQKAAKKKTTTQRTKRHQTPDQYFSGKRKSRSNNRSETEQKNKMLLHKQNKMLQKQQRQKFQSQQKRMKRNLQRQKQSYITDLQMETALKFRKKMEVLK